MLEIGSLVDGKYKILNKVGQGGMSVVYLAMNEKANKQWAVKEVRKDGVLDFEAVKQGLVAETEILKRLDHRNLPSIVDVIDTEESFIIIMDYIQGNDLMKLLDEYGAQPQEKVVEWGKQLADVLLYLHTQNPPIIYRDLKPKNIMLKPDGNEITLIDFGTAREFKENKSGDTVSLGTPEYAAPEQYGSLGQTDARTDIYGFGATMYHLLTGIRPEPLAVKPIREINPALSSGLESIILKCTQHDPKNRYQSAAELIYALENYEVKDEIYRKKQKKKLWSFLIPAFLTLVFAIASLWGYLSAEQKKKENYDFILANAKSVPDYYDAILTDPLRSEAYLGNDDFDGLIEFLTKDGDLTSEESGYLAKLKAGLDETNSGGYTSNVDVLGQLKSANPSGYEQVCYEIGEAYLFYYTIGVEKDKYATAATWFQYAQDSYPIAKMYCDISDCLQNIARYARADQVGKLYEEYQTLWEQVGDLNRNAQEFDDDLRIRVWNEIVNMIQNNAKEFCEVSSPQAILTMLSDILADSNGVTNTFLQNNIWTLRENIEKTTAKIQSIADSRS